MCTRRDSPSGALKEAVHELVWPSDILGKKVRKHGAIQIVWPRLEEQVGGEAASHEWDEDRQERVASACP